MTCAGPGCSMVSFCTPPFRSLTPRRPRPTPVVDGGRVRNLFPFRVQIESIHRHDMRWRTCCPIGTDFSLSLAHSCAYGVYIRKAKIFAVTPRFPYILSENVGQTRRVWKQSITRLYLWPVYFETYGWVYNSMTYSCYRRLICYYCYVNSCMTIAGRRCYKYVEWFIRIYL